MHLHRSNSSTLVFAALLAAAACSAAADARHLVEMPAPMVQHMLGNMRDHLLALTEIQEALGSGNYGRAADVAEKRIGMSSLETHGASHMAEFMPEPMQDIGTQMHRAASRFALVAQDSGASGNAQKPMAALAEVTRQCVSCHSAYRAH